MTNTFRAYVIFAFGGGVLFGTVLMRPKEVDSERPPTRATNSLLLARPSTSGPAVLRLLDDSDTNEADRLHAMATWPLPDKASCWYLLEKLEGRENPLPIGLLAQRILHRLASLDLEETFDRLDEKKGWRTRGDLLSLLCQRWAKSDLSAVADRIESMTDLGNLKTRLIQTAIDHSGSEAVALGVELLVKYQLDPGTGDRFPRLFGTLAKAHPDLAAAQAMRIASPDHRTRALEIVLREWGTIDAEAAAAFVLADPSLGTLNPSINRRSALWSAVAEGLAKNDPGLALQRFEQWTGRRDVGMVVQAMARSDPRAAYEWLKKNEPDRRWNAESLAKSWAAVDTDEALSWARNLEGEKQAQALTGIARTIRDADPAEAFRLYAEAGNGDGINILIRKSANRDWGGTLETLRQWEDPQLRANAALSMLEHAYAVSRPLGEDLNVLLEWIDEEMGDPDGKTTHHLFPLAHALDETEERVLAQGFPQLYQQVLPWLIDHYEYRRPSRAAELLLELEDPRALRKAVHSVFAQWAAQDPEAGRRWLGKHTLGEADALAREVFHHTLASFSPPQSP